MKKIAKPYCNPKLDARVKKELNLFETLVEINARVGGLSEFSERIANSTYSYKECHLMHLNLIMDVIKTEQPYTTEFEMNASNEALKRQKYDHINETGVLETTVAKNKSNNSGLSPVFNFLKKPAVFALIFSLTEGLGMYPILDDLGFGIILSTILSIVFGLLMYVLAHYIGKSLKKSDEEPQKKLMITVSCVAPIVIFFFLVAQYRTDHLANLDCADCDHIIVSPWLIFIFSTLFFIASISLSYFNSSDDSYGIIGPDYNQLKKDQKNDEKRIGEIIESDIKMTKENIELNIDAKAKNEYLKGLINQIMIHSEQQYENYKKIFRRHKPKGMIDCFLDYYPHKWVIPHFEPLTENGGQYGKHIK
ncbi:MAG: hypothetical protein Q8M15_02170 [Bacteroidota bacterium]|nr:hypothetical protein [Bacteroidota bacterium]